MPAPSSPTAEFIAGLPKAELHVHLEGTLEPEVKLALAERNGLFLEQDTVEEVQATYEFDSLASFLAVYYPAMDVLRTEQDFYDLAMAYLVRAKADGVVHAEMFFDPQAHTGRGVAFADVITGYHGAAVDAAQIGVDAHLIMCFLRDLPADGDPNSAEATLDALLASPEFTSWVIGVGLDSDERDNPPRKFAEVFARARQAGLHLTMHCDIDQPDSIEHIRQAIHEIGVERIDHGTNVVEDDSLVADVIDRGLGLTCCPVSNSFVTEDSKATEIVDLLGRGVTVTINSDDPAYFAAYVAGNYEALAQKAQLSSDQIIELARNSFRASWLTDEAREGYLADIDGYVADFTG
ncbi:adenosine deaminase [Gordonia jinhuaensis]|uniref:Adenine deaminase n=1 Tax=Gordonia jinhuaensis TaxID=1517702 RepID=A0A916T741_9ACTN|nr:adenosine deaminase [Gordonia jinhuaensis]GGB34216.1 adenine deaminase [Gordonia jinhuaensis]